MPDLFKLYYIWYETSDSTSCIRLDLKELQLSEAAS